MRVCIKNVEVMLINESFTDAVSFDAAGRENVLEVKEHWGICTAEVTVALYSLSRDTVSPMTAEI